MIGEMVNLLAGLIKFFLISPEYYAKSIGVTVGRNCRILSRNFSSEPYLIEIGNHVEISSGVTFITHDGAVWVFREEAPDVDVFGRIRIGDNTMIGAGATILPGVQIGKNCVVGAGSVVAKSIPDNSVVAGSPCHYVCSTREYKDRIFLLNAKTKGLKAADKKKAILALKPEQFVRKDYLEAANKS